MLAKILFIAMLSVITYGDVNFNLFLMKNGTRYTLQNNDVVFKGDALKIELSSTDEQSVEVYYKINNEEIQKLFQPKLSKDSTYIYPEKDDFYLILDEKKGSLTFILKSSNKIQKFQLVANPDYQPTNDTEQLPKIFDSPRKYIDHTKVISNHRGAKESEIIIPKLESATVIVSSGGGIGAGVVINDGKYILTNYHVVAPDENSVYVAFKPQIGDEPSKNSYYKMKVIKVDMIRDLALIEIPKTLQNSAMFDSLMLGDLKKIKKGVDIYTMGHPLKYYYAFEYGMLNKILVNHSWVNYQADYALQYSMNSNRGNSGGAIVTEDLKLIGLVAGSDTNGDNLNFGISVADIKKFLDAPENVRVETKRPNDYKTSILETKLYKNTRVALLDRDNNGIPDAMMQDFQKDGIWDRIAYDTDEDGSYERITSF